MSTLLFLTKSHIIPGQHIREYPEATANEQEDELQLSVKQYTPLSNQNPQHGDVTIIATHATGYPKVSSGLAIHFCSELTVHRSFTNPCGMNCSPARERKASAFDLYGWQTW